MGLDSLVNEQGYVHSDKDTENITFSRNAWKSVIQYHPDTVYTLITRESRFSSESMTNDEREIIKLFIELIDEILEEDGVEGTLSEQDEHDILYKREQLVEMIEG